LKNRETAVRSRKRKDELIDELFWKIGNRLVSPNISSISTELSSILIVTSAKLEAKNQDLSFRLDGTGSKTNSAVIDDEMDGERRWMGSCNKFGLALSLRGFTPNRV
jgi:hypothetical protein